MRLGWISFAVRFQYYYEDCSAWIYEPYSRVCLNEPIVTLGIL